MPDGFLGRASQSYLTMISTAMASAHAVHSQGPFIGIVGTSVAPPPLSVPTNHNLHHSVATAGQGSYRTGMGHHGNIVVKQSEYEQILGRIQAVDSRLAEEFHNICARIEEMCNTIYILPHMRPKYLELTGRVKASLVEFQALADDARMRTGEFVGEIIRIDSKGG